MATVTEQFAPALEAMRAQLSEIEEKVVTGYTMADAIREGSSVTNQETGGYGKDNNACALAAGAVAATARGYAM